ncbi:hypothetical protein K490DRAFT_56040 [Saccharata proteae CBS 121410]|uniref:Uncharacterized protein n=1 Tax=Saccharata proteae CBS 121410 TaxID=1314787 RepID=A0A9P4HYB3_9PEZI|nr:hypothetical protein K490DRAFT_56040 [Saccharata proteae CBS 121410]
MAFQQPQRPRAARPLSFSTPAQQQVEPQPVSSPQRKRPLEDSEEWVLFSPSQAPSTTRTHTTSTERTPRTAGLSRLSDFGSLDTAARSDQDDVDDDLTCHGSDPEDDGEEELDSLDDGLHAFHEPSEQGDVARMDDSGQTVQFPTHDGLGTFQVSSSAVQEQMWQFERYNASSRRKHQRRRSSVQRRLDALEDAEERSEQSERRQRIERWRLEQSRALLEEIERETRRRRRMSRASLASTSRTGSNIPESASAVPTSVDEVKGEDSESPEGEGFWQRFTRRVIRDLMGIDENLLSVIFGESLPHDALFASDPKGPAVQQQDKDLPSAPAESWEHRVLERIARELGILVHQLSEHPGAFSTYLRTQETPAYAGLNTSSTLPTISDTLSTIPEPLTTSTHTPSAIFAPTATHHPPPTQPYSDASLWGIEEEPERIPSPSPSPATAATAAAATQEREYWERDLDVKMVFTFLRDRFSSRPTSPTPVSEQQQQQQQQQQLPTRRDSAAPTPFTAGPSTSPKQHQRAQLIRQHHPLVSRNLPTASSSSPPSQHRRRSVDFRHLPQPQTQTLTQQPARLTSTALRRSQRMSGSAGGSSCASQSTRRTYFSVLFFGHDYD